MKRKWRALSALLAVLLVVTLLPVNILAEGIEEEKNVPSEESAGETVKETEGTVTENVPAGDEVSETKDPETPEAETPEVSPQAAAAEAPLLTAGTEGESSVVASGYCGNFTNEGGEQSVTWSLDNQGTLTISGNGNVKYYNDGGGVIAPDTTPWDNYKASILTVEIQSGITGTGSNAFRECSNLANVILPSGLNTIGSGTFRYCTSLSAITIQTDVTSIGANAFDGCTALTSATYEGSFAQWLAVSVDTGNEPLVQCLDFDGTKLLGSGKCGDNLHWYVTTDGLLSIGGSGAMSDYSTASTYSQYSRSYVQDQLAPWYTHRASIKSLEVDSGVTSIGAYAFYGCETLTSVTIPTSLSTIGSNAFSGCTGLTGVYISALASWCAIDFTDSASNPLGNAHSLYLNGTLVEEMIIPDSLSAIKNYVFYGCTSLRKVTIPASVTEIGSNVFSGCSNLTETIYEGTLEQWRSVKVGSYPTPFAGTLVVEDIHYKQVGSCGTNVRWDLDADGKLTIYGTGSIPDYSRTWSSSKNCLILNTPWEEYTDTIKTVVIESGITGIGTFAFYSCSALTSVSLPEGLVSIGNNAFNGCASLASVEILSGVKSIGSSAFNGCTSLASVKIPSGVSSIGDNAFSGCTALTKASLPESLETIPQYLFYGCTALYSVNIPENVTGIGRNAFYNCSRLQKITIPGKVESIGSYAFYNCSGLLTVSISSSVKSIEVSAFSGCGSLTGVYITNLTAWCNISFGSSSGGSYSNSNPLEYAHKLYLNGTLVESLTIPAGITSIKDHAFHGCTSITSVTIPEGVQSIGASAFNGCNSLTSVHFPESLSSLGDYCFQNCYALLTVDIPDAVKVIPSYAFSSCNCLSSVTIPEGIEEIRQYAFSYTALEEVTLPSTVSTIDANAFSIPSKFVYVGNIGYATSGLRHIHFAGNAPSEYVGSGFASGYERLYITYEPEATGFTTPEWNGYPCYPKGSVPEEYTYRAYGSCGSSSNEGGQSSVTWHLTADGVLVISGTGAMASGGWSSHGKDIKSVVIESGVTSIAASSFYTYGNDSYPALTSVSLPVSVVSIGMSAFEGCTSLTDVYYAGSVAEWSGITIEDNNAPLLNAVRHYGDSTTVTATLTDTGRSLSLSDLVYINQYCTIASTGLTESYICANGGLLVWNSQPEEVSYSNALSAGYVQKGLISSGSEYTQRTKGIIAKNYGTVYYMCLYLRMPDGTYQYTPLKEYGVCTYCSNKLQSAKSSTELKAMCQDMLDYGASAKAYFASIS